MSEHCMMNNQTIDFHAHWLPEALIEALRQRNSLPMVRRHDDGRDYLESAFNSSPMPGREDIEARLREMDANGVAHGILSLTTVYGIERLPSADALPLCQAYNNAVAEVCAKYPDRFSALASIPIADINVAVSEFERAMALPGLVGGMLMGDGFLSLKRAEKFRPLFESANRHKALFLVHYGKIADDPDAPKIDASDNASYRIGTLDMQARISSNMLTFCLTDFMTPYPHVTVLLHNLGGNIPYEIDRLDHRAHLDTPNLELPSKRIRAGRVIVDCNSLGPKSIELAMDVYGAERIVYGSDGTGFGMDWSNKAIEQARIPQSAKTAILYANGQALLQQIKSPAPLTAE
jgi:predicted TIM-barrel fold metal-dependent hydrolase